MKFIDNICNVPPYCIHKVTLSVRKRGWQETITTGIDPLGLDSRMKDSDYLMLKPVSKHANKKSKHPVTRQAN